MRELKTELPCALFQKQKEFPDIICPIDNIWKSVLLKLTHLPNSLLDLFLVHFITVLLRIIFYWYLENLGYKPFKCIKELCSYCS